jgi:Fur family zinc uptake transcriptional regulator
MATANPFPTPEHDHGDCVEQALVTAEKICRERGLRLTRIRRRVLELVWNSHKPVGAYDILDVLGREGQRSAPPTVYRALDFLIDADLVHRLDSLNAYVGCSHPYSSHTGQFLICRDCRSVAELDDKEISTLVDRKANELGFSAVRQMLEIQGLCPECQQKNQP